MSIDVSFTNGTRLVEVKSLTSLLSDFRQQLERESGGPINRLDANAAELLSDLCRFLGLSDQNRRKTLGTSGARYVDMIESIPSNPTIRH